MILTDFRSEQIFVHIQVTILQRSVLEIQKYWLESKHTQTNRKNVRGTPGDSRERACQKQEEKCETAKTRIRAFTRRKKK